jgi:hypothetical protein
VHQRFTTLAWMTTKTRSSATPPATAPSVAAEPQPSSGARAMPNTVSAKAGGRGEAAAEVDRPAAHQRLRVAAEEIISSVSADGAISAAPAPWVA